MSKKIKKEKKKKLDSIPKINRRLFKLWSEAVRSRVNFTCEYCGAKRGEKNFEGKPVKIDAHHLMNRDIRGCPLKFSISNGIAVCPRCHKFSPDNSFHLNPVVTINWLIKNRPERYEYVLNNYKQRVNLEDRDVLKLIESHLENKEDLDLKKIKEISDKNQHEKSQAKMQEEQYMIMMANTPNACNSSFTQQPDHVTEVNPMQIIVKPDQC